MIKSMTGYGESKNQNDYAHIHVEISSLNSRFFEFRARTCRILSIYDNEIKNKIKSNSMRGNFQLKTKIEFQNKELKSIIKELELVIENINEENNKNLARIVIDVIQSNNFIPREIKMEEYFKVLK